MEKINFICGGKTGDLIHNLYTIKRLCESESKKANLFITDELSYGGDSFSFGAEKAHQDLYDLVIQQKYIEKFEVLNPQEVPSDFINLNDWRISNLFMKSSWINLLNNHYNFSPEIGSWIEYKINEIYRDKIIIHRSYHRHSSNFPWERIINNNKCFFVSSDESIIEYHQFPYRNRVELIITKNLAEFFEIINSCKFFIGNMSTPLAIAHALDVPHLGELISPDEVHYIGDEKFLQNYYYFKGDGSSHIEGVDKFIVL